MVAIIADPSQLNLHPAHFTHFNRCAGWRRSDAPPVEPEILRNHGLQSCVTRVCVPCPRFSPRLPWC